MLYLNQYYTVKPLSLSSGEDLGNCCPWPLASFTDLLHYLGTIVWLFQLSHEITVYYHYTGGVIGQGNLILVSMTCNPRRGLQSHGHEDGIPLSLPECSDYFSPTPLFSINNLADFNVVLVVQSSTMLWRRCVWQCHANSYAVTS